MCYHFFKIASHFVYDSSFASEYYGDLVHNLKKIEVGLVSRNIFRKVSITLQTYWIYYKCNMNVCMFNCQPNHG